MFNFSKNIPPDLDEVWIVSMKGDWLIDEKVEIDGEIYLVLDIDSVNQLAMVEKSEK